MSRLTYKDLASYSGRINGKTLFDKVYNKLGELEDIEDELGCPLDVVFKALKEQYVIFKHTKGIENPVIKFEKHKIEGLFFNGKDFDLWLYENYGDDFCVSVKDYKKTWFLREEKNE